MNKTIPISIEFEGVSLEKDAFWSAFGYAVGKKVAGYSGGVIGALTQGNIKILKYRIWFSDGSYQDRSLPQNEGLVDLIIWNWRITNQKSESDYVTLGIDFSSLTDGGYIPFHWIEKHAKISSAPTKKITPGYSSEKNKTPNKLGDFWTEAMVSVGLKRVIKEELARYINDRKDLGLELKEDEKGFWITKKNKLTIKRPEILGIVILSVFTFLISVYLGFVISGNDQNPPSDQTPEVRQ